MTNQKSSIVTIEHSSLILRNHERRRSSGLRSVPLGDDAEHDDDALVATTTRKSSIASLDSTLSDQIRKIWRIPKTQNKKTKKSQQTPHDDPVEVRTASILSDVSGLSDDLIDVWLEEEEHHHHPHETAGATGASSSTRSRVGAALEEMQLRSVAGLRPRTVGVVALVVLLVVVLCLYSYSIEEAIVNVTQPLLHV